MYFTVTKIYPMTRTTMLTEEISTAFYQLISSKGLKILCAESITAGLLASTIASVPGASGILIGSVVTYDEQLKTALLHVNKDILDKHSAESIETSTEMVKGLESIVMEDTKADIFVAVTGLASKPKEVHKNKKEWGDISVFISYNGKAFSFEPNISPEKELSDFDSRNAIREKAVLFILDKITEIVSA